MNGAPSRPLPDPRSRDWQSLAPLRRWWYLPVLLALVGAALAGAVGARGYPTAQVIVAVGSSATDSGLMARSVSSAVVQLQAAEVFADAASATQTSISDLRRRTQVAAIVGSQAVAITVTAPTSQRALSEANAVANVGIRVLAERASHQVALATAEARRLIEAPRASSSAAEQTRVARLGDQLGDSQSSLLASSSQLSVLQAATTMSNVPGSARLAALGLVGGAMAGMVLALALGYRLESPTGMTSLPRPRQRSQRGVARPRSLGKAVQDPAPWLVVIFAINFFLERISIPGTTITVTVPLSVAWTALALHYRVLEINRLRLMLWLSAGALGALVVVPQLLFVASPFVSVNSWAFWMSIWLPGVTQMRDRSREQYLRCLRWVAQVGLVISGLSVLFVALQLVGVPYRDWLADIFPPILVVPEFATSYPVSYGSAVFKSNAWFALEPSYLSFILGACVAAAIIAKVHPVKVFVLLLGMLASTAGSGIAIIAVAVLGLALSKRRAVLKNYFIPLVVILAITAYTSLGRAISSRVTEAGRQGSSASKRAIEPYAHLWPQWVNDPVAVLFGRGAGSSRWLIDQDPEVGLLVPIAAKMLFDYGLIAGGLLILLIVSMYRKSPEPVLAVALAASMLLQEAGQPLVLCTLTLVTLWSPRRESQLTRSPAITGREAWPTGRTIGRPRAPNSVPRHSPAPSSAAGAVTRVRWLQYQLSAGLSSPRALPVVIAVGVLLRLLGDVVAGPNVPQYEFGVIGQNLADGRGFSYFSADPLGHVDISSMGTALPSAFMPPLYTFVVALAHGVSSSPEVAARVLQGINLLLAATSIYLFARLLRLLVGPQVAVLGAAFVACFPQLAYSSTQVSASNAYVPLEIGLLLLIARLSSRVTWPRVVLVGLLLGSLTWLRAEAVVLLPLAALWLWRYAAAPSRRRAFAFAACLLTVSLVLPVGWMVRNSTVLDRPTTSITTTAGFNFWIGNHPLATGSQKQITLGVPQERAFEPFAPELRNLTASPHYELDRDALFMNAATSYVRAHPGEVAVRDLKKLAMFFIGDVYDPRSHVLTLAVNLLLLGVGLWGWTRTRIRRRFQVLLAGYVVVSASVATVFFTLERYALPLRLVLAIFVAERIWALLRISPVSSRTATGFAGAGPWVVRGAPLRTTGGVAAEGTRTRSVVLITASDPEPRSFGKQVVLGGMLDHLTARLGPDQVHVVLVGSPAQAPRPPVPYRLHLVAKPIAREQLSALLRRVLLPPHSSLQEAALWSRRTRRSLGERLAKIDADLEIWDTMRTGQYVRVLPRRPRILYADDLFSKRYASMVRRMKSDRSPLVNPLGEFARNLPKVAGPVVSRPSVYGPLLRLEQSLTRHSEDAAPDLFDATILVNATEAAELARRTGNRSVHTLLPLVPEPQQTERHYDGSSTFVFLGGLDFLPNRDGIGWFLRSCRESVLAALPDFRLLLVGRGSDTPLPEAAGWGDHVQPLGWVADLDTVLNSCAALISPLRIGSGTKIKVLQAMAHGLPVVATPDGVLGLGVGAADGCLIGRSADDLAALLVEASDPVRNAALSAAARARWVSTFCPAVASRAYDDLFGLEVDEVDA